MAAPFVGNQDYRGYLNYLSQGGGADRGIAKSLLGFVGNDAKFGASGSKLQGYGPELAQSLVGGNQRLFQEYQRLMAPPGAPPGSYAPLPGYGGGGGVPRPVYAPKLDIGALNANARSQAEGAVNPYYTKVLSEFLAAQAARRNQRQTQYDTDVTNLQDALKSTLEANKIGRERTAEDVAENQAQINQTADEFQVDSGEQFTEDRLNVARDTAASGKTGGLGAQAQEKLTATRNTGEKRQVEKFQAERQAQELFKGRTFEDLFRSDTETTDKTEKGKKQAKFDLDSYIQNQGFEEQDTRNKLEQERLGRVADESRNKSRLLFNQYLAGIKDPAQYEAAVRTYGSLI